MKYFCCFFCLFISAKCLAQPNCNIYKWKGDSACYKACIELRDMEDEQGSAPSQAAFARAVALCPGLEYAWYEKSVPFLKRGDFITWRKLIDKAVELDPHYLLERGWCRYKFLRDYEGAIKDIDKLNSLFPVTNCYSGDGDYHINVLKALCYKGLGEKARAIETIEQQLTVADYHAKLYDYLHLGVLKLETGDYNGAIAALNKEVEVNDYLAETYYYLALAYEQVNNKNGHEKNIRKAREYYDNGKKMTDPYADPMDKIYLSDIEFEMRKG